MKKVSGYLFKRGGIWVVAWQANGKRFKRSTGTGTKREAERIRDEILAPFRMESEAATLQNLVERMAGAQANLARVEDKEPGILIKNAWTAFEASRKRRRPAPQTLQQYSFQWNRFERWLTVNRPAAIELRHVTEQDAADYANNLSKAVVPSTSNRHITFLRGFFRVLTKEKTSKMTGNPFAEIQPEKAVQQSRRELTIAELIRVCTQATGELRTLLAIGIYCGLRLADAVLLDWGAVDLVRNYILNRNRKTGKEVSIPIHPSLAGILQEIPIKERTGDIMPEMAALYRVKRDQVTDRIQAHFRACGIRTYQPGTGAGTGKRAVLEVGFHSMRHSFVSMNAAAGTPLGTMQNFVGHSNPSMTRHYIHEDRAAATRAICALPSVMGDTVPTALLAPAARMIEADKVRALAEGMNTKTWRKVKKEILRILT